MEFNRLLVGQWDEWELYLGSLGTLALLGFTAVSVPANDHIWKYISDHECVSGEESTISNELFHRISSHRWHHGRIACDAFRSIRRGKWHIVIDFNLRMDK